MDFLAADAMNGRGSLTREEHLAALYCAAIFESLGLKPAGDPVDSLGSTHSSYIQRTPVDLSHLSPRQKQRLATYEDTPRTETWNAIAMLPGTDPALTAQTVLLTAHLDHLGRLRTPVQDDAIFNGADDDASGVTAVLNLARSLAASPAPRRTVVFALFGSEELGGFGARAFLDHPPVPLTGIVANLEFEMIGRPDPAVPPGTLWLTGYERTSLGPELSRHGAHLVSDPHPTEHFFERSDNIQLARLGIVAQTVSSFGLHKDYHQVSDELKTIDFTHMQTAIESMQAPINWLVNSSWTPTWNPGGRPPPAQTATPSRPTATP